MNARNLPLLAAGAALLAALALPAGAAPKDPAATPSGQWPSPQVLWDKACGQCDLTGVGPELRGRALGHRRCLARWRRPPRVHLEVAQAGGEALTGKERDNASQEARRTSRTRSA